ncbi:hypothetical protein JOC37_002156 [Desulfohalotomaculum tongense]|uniref:DUF116 domain-containing protein n=1 Tax=Desulforadius tongensis TaxID=1216062 RepID=UPI00195CDEA9|nr:DUF116 domain-containing protein [Desulforadius tongensis]MBM7855741.1 hypothetical protein [Desulforadius tongensis]
MISSSMVQPQAKKRLFIGLLAASLLAVLALAGILWYLISHPTTVLQQVLLVMLIGAIIIMMVAVAFGIGGIVLTIWLAKTITPLQPLMRVAISLLFPVAIGLGRIFKIDTDKIKRSFIEVNNQLVRTKELKIKPSQLLVLAPHCLQKSSCPHKITTDISNCKRCGGCPVDKLLEIRDRWGVKVGLATGGTLARKYVKEYRPKAVVAIACERDLASGIQDASPLPVLGVLNERPFGPCFNTQISVPRVEEAIRYFAEVEK